MDIIVRASVMFVVLYLLLRLLGKRELGEMTPFEMVLLVVMGDLIQQGVTHNDFSLTGAVMAIGTFAFWGLLLSWLSYRFPRAKDALDGKPRVLVRDGEFLRGNFHRDRLTQDDVLSEMRMAGIARIDDVAWAILEPQGKISFIGKDGRDTAQQDESGAAT
jgi:uncharacterized membrane protein YcaP (DUF421 family)